MNFLILDTSTEVCVLALSAKGNPLVNASFPHGNNLSKILLPAIQQLLEKENLTLKDLNKIYVGIGPGSYTGTRVGVAVAKSLAFGLNIPVCGFCSLLAFLPATEGPFEIALKAQSGDHFVCKGNSLGHVSFVGLVKESDFPKLTHTMNIKFLLRFLPYLLNDEIQLLYLHHV